MGNLVNCACGSDNIKRLNPYGVESVQCYDCHAALREKDWNRIMGAEVWVGVEERLPDEETPVLVADGYNVSVAELEVKQVDGVIKTTWYALYDGLRVKDDYHDVDIACVSEWKPLPTLPKEA